MIYTFVFFYLSFRNNKKCITFVTKRTFKKKHIKKKKKSQDYSASLWFSSVLSLTSHEGFRLVAAAAWSRPLGCETFCVHWPGRKLRTEQEGISKAILL